MQTLSDLQEYLSKLPNAPKEYRVAVGSLVFTQNDSVLLLERGREARDEPGKLEGIGGGVDEGETNLHEVLLREIKEEIGDMEVNIEKLLTVMVRPSTKNVGQWWVVPIYLCKLISGTLSVMEPHKCAAIHELKLEDIPEEKLTEYQKETMNVYKTKYNDKPFYQMAD